MILLWIGLDPKTPADRDNLVRGLDQLIVSEPSVSVRPGANGTVLLGATRDDQMEAIVDRLAREFDVEATVTRLEIAYKEALTRAAEGEGKYTHRHQYGHVKLRVEPGARGSGYVFANEIVGGAIPDVFIAAIDEGVCDVVDRGVLAGYPMDDLRVTLFDGSYHDVDSTREAFRKAAALAFDDAARKARPVLLEPIVAVSLILPDDCAPRCRDMLAVRGAAEIQQTAGEWMTLSARMPLSATFGLTREAEGRSAGRAICSIRFTHYAPVTHAGDDGDREAGVREPKPPRTPPRLLRASVPEPPPPFTDEWQSRSSGRGR